MVRRARQAASEISHLQGLAAASAPRHRQKPACGDPAAGSVSVTTTRPNLSVDGLITELRTLAQISEAEPPVVTRVVFSEADRRARAYVKGLCADAGLSITEDAVGNTFARWQ